MKLWKAFTIFYPRRYRVLLGGILAGWLLYNAALAPFVEADLRSVVSIFFVSLTGIIIHYGDMEVFAGTYNREGGQIACCQASFYGEKTMRLGYLADRLACFGWLLLLCMIQYVWGYSYFKQSVWSMLMGCLTCYSVTTVGINISRHFITMQGCMFIGFLFGSVSAVGNVLFLVIYPVGTWYSVLFMLFVSAALTAVTVRIAQKHIKRSYCDA